MFGGISPGPLGGYKHVRGILCVDSLRLLSTRQETCIQNDLNARERQETGTTTTTETIGQHPPPNQLSSFGVFFGVWGGGGGGGGHCGRIVHCRISPKKPVLPPSSRPSCCRNFPLRRILFFCFCFCFGQQPPSTPPPPPPPPPSPSSYADFCCLSLSLL